MYRIKVVNTQTGVTFYEYGFTKRIMESIYNMFHEKDSNFYHIYEIVDMSKLVFNFNTFKKCLTRHIEFLSKGVDL